MNIVAISAGLSEDSTTNRLAGRLLAAAKEGLSASDVNTQLVELRPIAHGIMDAMLMGFVTGDTEHALELVGQADGLIIATPLYATTYSGLLKCFIDILAGSDPSNSPIRNVPTLLAATGGTPRHSLALDYSLRPLFSYLHADVLSTVVFAATDDWAGAGDQVRPLTARIERAGRELAAAMQRRNDGDTETSAPALATESAPKLPAANPFTNTPTFEQMLNQL